MLTQAACSEWVCVYLCVFVYLCVGEEGRKWGNGDRENILKTVRHKKDENLLCSPKKAWKLSPLQPAGRTSLNIRDGKGLKLDYSWT